MEKKFKLSEWQIKLLKEMPEKVIVNSRRWAGKRNYYKALKNLRG